MTKNTTGAFTGADPGELLRLLTPGEVAAVLGVPVATLYAWRYHSKGPPAILVGRHLRYPADDLRIWIAERGKEARHV